MTAEQARALADAIEARDRARENLRNAAAWGGAQDGALGSEQDAQADERLAAAGYAYVVAEMVLNDLLAGDRYRVTALGEKASGTVAAGDDDPAPRVA